MKANCSEETLRESLNEVNTRWGYKIEFNRFERIGRWVFFTLKTRSGIPGSRLSGSGRKGPWVSWHAHGYLFEQILVQEENTVIWSGGKRITAKGGNWEDRNIGSMVSPLMFSQTSIL
jgi:hypothetical protein